MRGRCPSESHAARQAKERLAQLIGSGLTIERHGRDRYRRTLAVVRDRRGREVAAVMVREGHARPYNGRTRRLGWCSS
ncbi:thermonuclease family protein [Roseococcus sp. YIM B11640]|uniref:thermonuclease family protein n=1 Tax=Roseococcus sp. YIM B11640 TaxID=3133973 RepID=UPI003C7AE739